ncbi:MAG: FecR domain-containing protein [Chitinophagaceae bacterium]
MDSIYAYDDIPWELIIASFQKNFPAEESAQLLQWISEDPQNQEKFEQLRRIWQEELPDYELYSKADITGSWESLKERIDTNNKQEETGKVVRGAFSGTTRRWVAAAAVILLVAGAGYLQFGGRDKFTNFETLANEQKKIALPDGSSILLKENTLIRVSGNFNMAGRTVLLAGGEAFFDVQHIEGQPFVVKMDGVSVRDIGTSFSIRDMKDSIQIIVSSGKVAIINNKSSETKEVVAGSLLCFYRADQRFGEIKATATRTLQFDDIALSDVIAILEKVYGKKIRLKDTAIGQKRFTARHMDAESFENAIKVICTSLNLQYAEENGVIILKGRD